jgi:glycosyltransferase involved in cell wall biosynthesis
MTPKKRVAFVTLSVGLGSIIYSNIKFARRLLALGHEVDFVGIEEVVEEDKQYIPRETQCFSLNVKRVRSGPLAFFKYAASRRPDAIFVSGHLTCLVCAVAVKLLPYKPSFVAKVHVSTKSLLSKQKTFFDRNLLVLMLRAVAPRQTRFVAVSSDGSREFERSLLLKRNSVTTLYDPVFPKLQSEAPPAEHEWLTRKPGLLALFVGRYEMEKDIPTLLKAMVIARKANPEIRLLMFGRGEGEQDVREMVSKLALDDCVSVNGYVDPENAYRNADVLVVSSIYEGLCNVIIEALAEGCRVVSTDCPVGPREVLEDGRHGQLVPVGDAEALAEAILRAPSLPFNKEAAARRAMDFHLDSVWPTFAELAGLPA